LRINAPRASTAIVLQRHLPERNVDPEVQMELTNGEGYMPKPLCKP
jgi:hypothetical protein